MEGFTLFERLAYWLTKWGLISVMAFVCFLGAAENGLFGKKIQRQYGAHCHQVIFYCIFIEWPLLLSLAYFINKIGNQVAKEIISKLNSDPFGSNHPGPGK
jgi:hypothetical protein